MQDDDLATETELSRALAAWSAHEPPADFAERVVAVLAARDAAPPPRSRGLRARWIGGIAIAGAACALAVVAVRSPHRAAHGSVTATQRTTAALGDRGIAVIEPAGALTWRIAGSGAAELTQSAGNVFYRVERDGPFVVHTPAGDVHATGTCFRIEVIPMTPSHKLLLAGLTGAAIASTVLVTVYEGRVTAETRSAKTEITAGGVAKLRAEDATITTAPAAIALGDTGASSGDTQAVREQLLAQLAELEHLRTRLAERQRARGPGRDVSDGDADRPWHDPGPETLLAWAAECHVRADDPALDQFKPLRATDTSRGMSAGEVDAYNTAMTEVAKQWKDLVRSLYVETTGDAAGADQLSVEAMRREIEDKNPREERPLVLQKLSRERAGLAAPPADVTRTSTLERLMRAFVQLGDQSEAALASRIGAERARAIRGDGWGSRSDSAECPAHATHAER
jgi:hypothetical protein